MEQVWMRLHVRAVSTITEFVSGRARRGLEYGSAATAVVLFALLTSLHCEYVKPRDGGCLREVVPPLNATLLDDGGGGLGMGSSAAEFQILQIQVLPPPPELAVYTQLRSTVRSEWLDRQETQWTQWWEQANKDWDAWVGVDVSE
eukprot:CAMPEP_0119478746 /NCGR_PEP_ID=MMETSP1344-20130328/8344_1 /TAXON_ID=236787 /ORGANISM="Florenciella parvula, Strain CCMP2471" /LENGTH=144 /DNA_ID=CAMNT_0007512943 /DNA_START=70 /DNA_END=501 /DNA_ORIENTATION=+